MGNLVFKPATGGGNKVIFQNQGGSDAITVEDSGAIAIAGNTTLSGSANNLGTVTAGAIPYQLTTGRKEIQSTYGFHASDVAQVISTSNTNTMTGAPYTIQTYAVDTGSATNTVWKISGYAGVNNESGAANWNCSMRFWVSYDGGGNWAGATPGTVNAGNYMWYSSASGAGDEYDHISGAVWVNGTGHPDGAQSNCALITANQSNTVFGMALFSAEQDNCRWNMQDSLGVFIHVAQYQL